MLGNEVYPPLEHPRDPPQPHLGLQPQFTVLLLPPLRIRQTVGRDRARWQKVLVSNGLSTTMTNRAAGHPAACRYVRSLTTFAITTTTTTSTTIKTLVLVSSRIRSSAMRHLFNARAQTRPRAHSSRADLVHRRAVPFLLSCCLTFFPLHHLILRPILLSCQRSLFLQGTFASVDR